MEDGLEDGPPAATSESWKITTPAPKLHLPNHLPKYLPSIFQACPKPSSKHLPKGSRGPRRGPLDLGAFWRAIRGRMLLQSGRILVRAAVRHTFDPCSCAPARGPHGAGAGGDERTGTACGRTDKDPWRPGGRRGRLPSLSLSRPRPRPKPTALPADPREAARRPGRRPSAPAPRGPRAKAMRMSSKTKKRREAGRRLD